MFEGFWYAHHLFILYYALLAVHGTTGLLEDPTFWIWVAAPCIFYLIERMIRIGRGSQTTIVRMAYAHRPRVLELRIKKPTFVYKPGQYIFLACPSIANYEWHPFTISSSPDEDFLSVHIRIVGDWTGKLWRLMNPDDLKDQIVQEDLTLGPNGTPILLVDGPFGAASEDVFKFKNVALFAAGIGVTPFASILKAIKFEIENNEVPVIENVHFYWTNRDTTSFDWFTYLLRELEEECPFLRINLYFTGQLNADQVRDLTHGGEDGGDPFTGLKRSKVLNERPNIKGIISELAENYNGQTLGVFFCGPQVLSEMLKDACKKCTDARSGTKIKYHKENF